MNEPRLVKLSPLGAITAYTLVDEDDYEFVSRWRWQLNKDGYAQRIVRSKATKCGKSTLTLHRALLGLEIGGGGIVDHINRNRLDNRRVNLRVVDHAGNALNSRPYGRGVSLITDRTLSKPWVAKVASKRLGYFASREDAEAAVEAERERIWLEAA